MSWPAEARQTGALFPRSSSVAPIAVTFGPDYDARRGLQWRELLRLEERAVVSERSPDWARRNLGRIVSCLPASEADLDDLLDQLRVTPVSAHPEQVTGN